MLDKYGYNNYLREKYGVIIKHSEKNKYVVNKY